MASKSDFTPEEWKIIVASNEGGIFGFGGERVSDAEKNVLRQIAFALGQPAS